MQNYTSLECNGLVASVHSNGLLLKSMNGDLFECITRDNKIVTKSKSTVSFSSGSSMVVNGSTFIQCSSNGTQRFIVDGVDVTSAVKKAVSEKKVVKEEDNDSYKSLHVVSGTINLSDISVSGTTASVIENASLLDKETLDLTASGSTSLEMPMCVVGLLDVNTSGCGLIKGEVTSQRVIIKSSGSSCVKNFFALQSAKLSASGCSSINIKVRPEANITKNKSGCGKISVVSLEE